MSGRDPSLSVRFSGQNARTKNHSLLDGPFNNQYPALNLPIVSYATH